MNREILFRGKSKGKWVQGNSYEEWDSYPYLSESEHGVIYFIGQQRGDRVASFIVDPETIGQYTGLKDKNGAKIFEGDIIELFENKKGAFEVVFVNAYVGGWVLSANDKRVSLGARKTEDIEVIGNIHDNPELLND